MTNKKDVIAEIGRKFLSNYENPDPNIIKALNEAFDAGRQSLIDDAYELKQIKDFSFLKGYCGIDLK